ncbi:uncharacterized protein IL334_007140 [Kwoniella shivajii]|uniref:Uncharacterized protein n=1 Tax=Kwoniella shivajii TaxID=564305 RepID=A0ABZ1DAZ8_9TREE|nr:hypothetical protein IL334_007140 [Kwoniella shivajii]
MSDNNNSPNTTLDDSDVNWNYGGDAWGTNHTIDPLIGQYHEGTFHSTTVNQAWARLCWTGTDLIVYGAKRKNHALYTVVVDNGGIEWFDGQSDESQIQAQLYASQGLEWGNHQIVLTNMFKANMTTKDYVWFDIDYAQLSGWPIDCKDLPQNTVTPSGTIAPPITSSSMVNSAVSSTSQPFNSSSSSSSTSNDTSVSVNGTSTSNITSSANSTASLTKVATTANSSFTLTGAITVPSSIRPTTTITMSSSTSESPVPPTTVSNNSTVNSTGAPNAGMVLRPGSEGHLAFAMLLAALLMKWL